MKLQTILLTALLILSTSVTAQTITVSAVGESEVRPDTIVLSGGLTEANEKMKDAVTAFSDTRRRAMAAIKEMGIENLSVSTSALSVDLAGSPQANPFGGEQPNAAPAGSLIISQLVTLTVTGVDKMEEQAVIDLVVKLMQGAKEAGVKMESASGPEAMIMIQMGMGGDGNSSAQFKISDPKAAHKAATKDAVDKARADAAYLAELAGGKLGKIVDISDGVMPATGDDSAMNPYAMIFGMMTGETADAYSSDTLDAITVARPLSVSFELIND